MLPDINWIEQKPSKGQQREREAMNRLQRQLRVWEKRSTKVEKKLDSPCIFKLVIINLWIKSNQWMRFGVNEFFFEGLIGVNESCFSIYIQTQKCQIEGKTNRE